MQKNSWKKEPLNANRLPVKTLKADRAFHKALIGNKGDYWETMGCGTSGQNNLLSDSEKGHMLTDASSQAFKAAVLIQRWYRRYVARLEMRRRCTWRIFQSIEYSGEQDHLKLNHFFDYLVDQFMSSNSKDRDFINRVFSENEIPKDPKLDKACNYEVIQVPEYYKGPHLSFPLSPDDATVLLDAFKKEQQLHARYVLKLFHETLKHLSQLPNISNVSTCYSEEITVCGDLHGQLNDLFLIFYKNGLPSPQKRYVFNGDFVDRGKQSIEILIILFAFLLIYPKEVHLNRGNHEDYMINLRYGFTKEVMRKYREHGTKILKLLRHVFSSLPLATLIDQKVLIVHGGVSDMTDLEQLAQVDRRKIFSLLTQRRKSEKFLRPKEVATAGISDVSQQPSFFKRVQQSVIDDLQSCRRLAGLVQNRGLETSTSTPLASVSEVDVKSYESVEVEQSEIKQVIDILWSDPHPHEGCRMNGERGGGCYFGPDVTENILQKHGLQLLIRSHECKPEGYEFCHNRKVITIFSASNYYAIGSNRGAYLKLGPDLIPHFVQYQGGKMAAQLTMTQRITRVEETAYQALRERMFAHRSDLIAAFKSIDKKRSGVITLSDWATAVESILHLGLPWRMLRPQLVPRLVSGKLDYNLWLKDIAMEQKSINQERIQSSLLETIYRNLANLETIFNIIDSDHSGLISFEEFHQTWKLFSTHMNIEISESSISDLARSIDFNKDGNIDFNEFLEAFRISTHAQTAD
ncbi:serine/threonine-protein phosphatase with EF-hands 2 [Eublepharis macularius]|uniref:Serine/threonine-protein phosphatase with EF-hands n=1 Tax=Eublepharis macularius TaxID=481883 RepID=A0AA97K122_EUBMA|nr:serine/threonine-protein phosphatase with EF-hands 2 [Eublepharis macularius]